MKIAENSVKGITTPLEKTKSQTASVQAAWRFYNNDHVEIKTLFGYIETQIHKAIEQIEGFFVLVASDWSWLDYKNHTAKEDVIVFNKKGNSKQIGYELQGSLLIDPHSGHPLAPAAINLRTAQAIYSTYDETIDPQTTHLNELSARCEHMDTQLHHVSPNKQAVHIIDREADSILFMRQLQKEQALFLIRVKENATVYWDEEERVIKQKDLANALGMGKEAGTVTYHKQTAKLFVNECAITLTRDYTKMMTDATGKRKRVTMPGAPVHARFVISRVVDRDNNILATWMLVTNVPKEQADTRTIATWYYYRWNIESFFKLLKTAGFNLEQWQQESPLALFRRLIVVAYAVVLVLQLANDESNEAKEVRAFLIKLSGKLMEYGVEYTLPALLSGLWVFLRTIDLLEHFSLEEIYRFKEQATQMMAFDLFGGGG